MNDDAERSALESDSELSFSVTTSDSVSTDETPATCKRKKPDMLDTDYNNVLKKVSELKEKIQERDAADAFGEYVTMELKKLDPLEQAMLKADISNTISTFLINKLTTKVVYVNNETNE